MLPNLQFPAMHLKMIFTQSRRLYLVEVAVFLLLLSLVLLKIHDELQFIKR